MSRFPDSADFSLSNHGVGSIIGGAAPAGNGSGGGRTGPAEPYGVEPVDASDPKTTADPGPHVCKRCGAGLTPGAGDFYLVAIEAVADPTPPTVAAEDLAEDIRRRIERLLAQLEGVSEQEALDQVYRRVAFYLCGPCFRRWIDKPTG